MKSFFENRTWTDEISFWKYVQTINKAPSGIPDGYYMIEMKSDIGHIQFQEEFYFSVADKDRGIEFACDRDYTFARIDFKIYNGILNLRAFTGHEIYGCDKFEDNHWVNKSYTDFFGDLTEERPKFTIHDKQKAAQALLELLKVNGKKVS